MTLCRHAIELFQQTVVTIEFRGSLENVKTVFEKCAKASEKKCNIRPSLKIFWFAVTAIFFFKKGR